MVGCFQWRYLGLCARLFAGPSFDGYLLWDNMEYKEAAPDRASARAFARVRAGKAAPYGAAFPICDIKGWIYS